MRNPFYCRVNILFVFISVGLFYSCGGGEGNTGTHVTEIDSTRDSTEILHIDQMEPDEGAALNTGSAVRVAMGENADFNWEDFRNRLQAGQKAIGEGFHMGEDEVASSWERFNDDYSYQTVYRYRENQLWLQTYYRSNDSTSETDSLGTGKGQLLTRDVSRDAGLAGLWEEMEEKARNVAGGMSNL